MSFATEGDESPYYKPYDLFLNLLGRKPHYASPLLIAQCPSIMVRAIHQLHIHRHVFSYTHKDIVARYMRMNGRNIFYAIGWDDNGLRRSI